MSNNNTFYTTSVDALLSARFIVFIGALFDHYSRRYFLNTKVSIHFFPSILCIWPLLCRKTCLCRAFNWFLVDLLIQTWWAIYIASWYVWFENRPSLAWLSRLYLLSVLHGVMHVSKDFIVLMPTIWFIKTRSFRTYLFESSAWLFHLCLWSFCHICRRHPTWIICFGQWTVIVLPCSYLGIR